MDRLFSHLLSNVIGYMAYQSEHEYMTSRWGCKKTTNELCLQVRNYQQSILPNPRIEDLIRYAYRPCDRTCPYYISQEDAIPLLIYSIKEYGKILSCKSLYGIALFHITEERFPTELELVLFEQFMNHAPVSVSNPDHVKEIPRASPRLQPYILKKEYHDSCCICQDKMTKGQEVVTLSCMHTFHIHYQTKENECLGIESWLAKSDECPLCKQKVI